jgi:hypothetical protein
MLLVDESLSNYWFDIKSRINSDSNQSFRQITAYEKAEIGDYLSEIEFAKGCASSKGCFFEPNWCRNECGLFLGYQKYGLYARFEMYARVRDNSNNYFVQIRITDRDGHGFDRIKV